MKILPTEIIDMIVQLSSPDAIPQVLRCSSTAYALGCKALYRHIAQSMSEKRYILLLKTLSTTGSARPSYMPHPNSFVRTLHLDFTPNQVTSNLLRLVHRALLSVPHLKDLHLEFSHIDSRYPLGWVLEGFAAPLEVLTTSLRCDATLARFLESQPLIRDLSLRGYQLSNSAEAFALSPAALPRLTNILVVHAGAPVLRAVVAGRPVVHAGVTLFREDADEPCLSTLDALACGTCPLRRLTLLTLDDTTRPDEIIQAVATRMPGLEALHVVVLLASYTLGNLFAATVHLKQMRRLKYLTFMAGEPLDGEDDAPHTLENERRVVGAWGTACPTLRSVILPKGQLWYEQQGKWRSGATVEGVEGCDKTGALVEGYDETGSPPPM